MSFADDVTEPTEERASPVADLSAIRRERDRLVRVDRLLEQLEEYRSMLVDDECPRPLQLRAARILDAVADAAAAREAVWQARCVLRAQIGGLRPSSKPTISAPSMIWPPWCGRSSSRGSSDVKRHSTVFVEAR